ncbi:MAG: alginate lyase family protein [Candidatus Sulfotelmatobacter sp.]
MSSASRCAAIVWALLLMAASYACAGDSPLRSPWDLHPVTATDAALTCPAAPQLPHDFATNSYYTDSHHSVIDPVLKKRYEDSVAGIEDFSRVVVKAADAFQTTGSRGAAQCVASLLESAARQKTLAGTMDGHQAFYVQKWNLGSWAVAYLKIRGSGLVSDEQNKDITAWLKNLAESSKGYCEEKRRHGTGNDAYNNHLYWAGFAIAAAAIANNDRSLFRWAVDAYKQGAHDIREDGTLPMEMDRGQMALHYHLFSLAALAMLAEFGETNGLGLYAERDYAIKRLISRCVEGLQDPSYFQQKTGVPQVTTPEIAAWEISWAQPYTRRYPDPKISELLAKAPHLNYTMLGGLPPP